MFKSLGKGPFPMKGTLVSQAPKKKDGGFVVCEVTEFPLTEEQYNGWLAREKNFLESIKIPVVVSQAEIDAQKAKVDAIEAAKV